MAAIIVLAILAFLLFVLAFSCIKIVRPYQRGVVERLGRYKGTVDPGLRVIVPFVDRVHLVDMREQVGEVPAHEVITSDHVVVSVYAILYDVATGAILEAQGQSEAIRRLADAEKYRQTAVAEGEASATRAVFSAMHDGNPTPDLLALKYLEALRVVANGQATKIFLPTEMSGLFGAVGGLAEMLREPSSDGEM